MQIGAPKSRTTLGPLPLANEPPADSQQQQPPPAQSQAPANQNPNTPPPPGGTNGAPPPPGGQTGGAGTPPAHDDPNAEPITLTRGELDTRIQSAVSGALRDHQLRQTRQAQRQQNQNARQAAEQAGDAEGLLTVERTEHQQTRDELTTAQRERDEARREVAVMRVGQNHKLSPQVVALLVNNTAITDDASAEKVIRELGLSQLQVLPKAPNTDAGAGGRAEGQRTQHQGNGRGAGRQQQRQGPPQRQARDDDQAERPARRYAWQSDDDVAYPPR